MYTQMRAARAYGILYTRSLSAFIRSVSLAPILILICAHTMWIDWISNISAFNPKYEDYLSVSEVVMSDTQFGARKRSENETDGYISNNILNQLTKAEMKMSNKCRVFNPGPLNKSHVQRKGKLKHSMRGGERVTRSNIMRQQLLLLPIIDRNICAEIYTHARTHTRSNSSCYKRKTHTITCVTLNLFKTINFSIHLSSSLCPFVNLSSR